MSDTDEAVIRRRQQALGRKLRQMYDGVVADEVPDEFIRLLGGGDTDGSPPSSPPPSNRPPVGRGPGAHRN
jgi:hypothetical protein